LGNTARDRILMAIDAWTAELKSYPGWKEWQRERIRHTLYFDDPYPASAQERLNDFKFSDEVEKQHSITYGFLGLSETITALKECEYYFRRYPFRGLPVSRSSHVTNVCEMYFGRFYEFRERLRKYLKAVAALAPASSIKIGAYIRAFDRIFDHEIRARHSVHHHHRFDDIAIDRVFLTDSLATNRAEDRERKKEHLAAYRKVANEWALRVQRRSQSIEEFLEAVAEATLSNCCFLSDLISATRQPLPVSSPNQPL